MFIFLISLFLLAVIIYVAVMIWDARHQITNSPRTDMYVCEKHGAFPSKYLFELTGITPEPIKSCPFCYEDRIKEARGRYIEVYQKDADN